MKFIINPTYLTLVLLFFTVTQTLSQTTSEADTKPIIHNYDPLEVGLLIGGANAYGDLVDGWFLKPNKTSLAYGLFLRYNTSRNFSLRANLLRGTLTGSDEDSKTLSERGISFETPITEISLLGEWDFLGERRYSDHGRFNRTISPYIFVGVGAGMTKVDVDFSNIADNQQLQNEVAIDLRNQKDTHLSLPFGIGVKADISEKMLLTLELGLRPVFNDYLDGVSAVGNAERNDWYSVGGITVAYRFGSKDQDKDGIADKKDPCPTKWGTVDDLGCPDSDNDGLTDLKDKCPDLAGSERTGGCPDSDNDGIADHEDNCPNVPGSKAAKGCLDSDNDGIVNSEDDCPYLAGTPELNGCRDSDKDGIADHEDQCPYEKGIADLNGCPQKPEADPNLDSDSDGVVDLEDDCPFIPGTIEAKGCRDSDKDGIADNVDRCPHEKGLAEYDGCSVPDRDRDGVLDAEDHCPDKPGTINGCPDSDSDGFADDADPCPDKAGANGGCPDTDSDGLADNMDDCPEQAGPVDRKGCPLLSEADKSVLLSAVDNISFHQGSYKLVATSYPMLTRIAGIMKNYPTYHLKIEGYTDNQGNDQANLQLSEMRAKACLEYLHKEQGIAKERMSFKGYGKANPRASNDTMSGRRRNRRVEFNIHE